MKKKIISLPTFVSGLFLFGLLLLSGCPQDEYAESDPEVLNKWARSNIYYDLASGSVTFAETGTDKQGYQGLFFKWGSLVGIAAGANGAFSGETYLYIPDLGTGKYYKVKSSEVSTSYGDGNSPASLAVRTYATSASNGDWENIPYASSADIDATAAGRGDNRLTTSSASLYADYKGDICKFLSAKKSASGLTASWVLPVSNEFSAGTGPIPSFEYSDFNSNDPDGTASNSTGLYTFTYSASSELVIFPAGGFRYEYGGGRLTNVGENGFYWSSSTDREANAYLLNFYEDVVAPDDQYNNGVGMNVRCVRE